MLPMRFYCLPSAAIFAILMSSASTYAFDDKDCASVEAVQQSYSIELKASDSVESARSKATDELVKQAIAQVVGIEIHSDRAQSTQVLNDTAQEKYNDAENARLHGLARVRITDEKRTALPTGQTLTLSAEVKVCVPKPEALRRAEKEQAERLSHPPKAVRPDAAVWFNPANGAPQIWYVRREDGNYSFFDNPGFDPESGSTLKPISSKAIREWKASILQKQREEKARAEADRRADAQKRLDLERDRMAAEQRANLLAHARENCDRLAANPNDPEKPKEIVGASYDDMRAVSDQAVAACTAAVQSEPTDRRLRYQLARAISINDPKKAMPLFKGLCDQRYPAAYDNYGWAFVDRRVALHNLDAALAFFKKGAQLGDSDAMVSLAGYIKRNKVPGSNLNDAIVLLRRAAALGNDDANKALQPILEAEQQAELQRQQAERQRQEDMRNAQAIIGLFGGVVGGMRR